jgi:hypothetical protein
VYPRVSIRFGHLEILFPMTVRFRWVALLLTLVTISTAGCAAKAARRNPRVPVTVAKVERRPVPVELAASNDRAHPVRGCGLPGWRNDADPDPRRRLRADGTGAHRARQPPVPRGARTVARRARTRSRASRGGSAGRERAQKMLEQNLDRQADYDQARRRSPPTAPSPPTPRRT